MGLFSKNKKKEFKSRFMTVNGTQLSQHGKKESGIDSERTIDMTLHDDCIEFTYPLSKITPIKIDYYSILSYEKITDEEIRTKKKSVIKSAVVGGVLFGGVGAIVGALDATNGDKVTKKKKNYFVINALNDNGDEETYLLEIVPATKPHKEIIEQLDNKTGGNKNESKEMG